MLCSAKSRARTHSIHGNQPLLARVDPRRRLDACRRRRGARHRQRRPGARIQRPGRDVLPVKVTDRIAPGVVSIKEGAWFAPDASGTDTSGCANALAEDRAAPCGATTYNTNLVEIASVNSLG